MKPERKFFIPKTLHKVRRIADDCVTLSIKIEDRFQNFMEVAAELLEVSTIAQGVYDEKSKDTEMAIEAAKKEKQYAKQEKDQLEQQYDLNEKEIQNAFEELKKSLESMPMGICMPIISLNITYYHQKTVFCCTYHVHFIPIWLFMALFFT
jgi:hypothetical protein